jgi:hypothetical protein
MRIPALAVMLALLAACQNTPPLPPNPSTGKWASYGGNEPTVNGTSFAFPTSSAGTAGYFYTQLSAKAGQTLTLNYSITGSNPVWAQHVQSGGTILDIFGVGESSDQNPASLTLFLWRQGDDLGGGQTGKASYRFWCPTRALLKLGANQTLSCKIDGSVWTNVAGQVDPNGFAAALANALGLGLTFGGQNFFGHGVYLQSGSATFTINSFTVQ